ncbi:MAG: universal stress protein [Kiloniellales bacterium]|nr:universal stress protein [Kiloniellales bacterium]
MSIKSILVPVTDGPAARGTVESAMILARGFTAHTLGLPVVAKTHRPTPDSIMRSRTSVAALNPDFLEMLDVAQAEEPEELRRLRALFEATAGDLQIEWIDGPPLPPGRPSASVRRDAATEPDEVAAYGRVFDLVVLSQPKNDPDHRIRRILRAILFKSGRPVVIAPETPPSSIGARILIAWDGSALSARAAAVARQRFDRVEAVGILTVRNGRGETSSAEDLAAYWAPHGATPSLIEVGLGDRRLGDCFLEQAEAFGADLFVMGAYAQSPFRESLTNGVTNYVLSHADLPVLMTH